jgi:GAF domain-containing protein
VARLLEVPIALVSIVSDDRQFFPAGVGLGAPYDVTRQTPISMSFCQHVVRGDAPLRVTDSVHDDRVKDNPAVEELDVKAYLGVPLRAPGGEPLGSLCAVDNRPREWTDDQLAVLQEVADATAQAIAVRTSEHRWAKFAGEASHRLTTPIAAIRLELDDLSTWPELADDARRAVIDAAHQAQALGEVVDDLTALARARRRIGLDDVELGPLVVQAIGSRQGEPEVTGDADVRANGPLLRNGLEELVAVLRALGATRVRAEIEQLEAHARVLLVGEGLPAVPPPPTTALRDRVLSILGGRVAARATPAPAYELILPLEP